jgi:hypothetical protein
MDNFTSIVSGTTPDGGGTLKCYKYLYRNVADLQPQVLPFFVVYVPIYAIFIFFGIIGNGLSYLALGAERPCTSTSVLLRSLAIADTLVLVSRLLYSTLQRIYTYFAVLEDYKMFYEEYYKYLWTFVWVAKTWSVYVTICVAGERFIAICKPLKAASLCTIKKARLACLSVVVFSCVYRMVYLFPYKTEWHYDPCTDTYKPKWGKTPMYFNKYYRLTYILFLHNLLMSWIPIFCLIFFTYRLLAALKQSAAIISASQTTSGGRASDNVKATTVRVLAVVVVFIILELPGSLIQIVGIVRSYAENGATLIDYYIYNYILSGAYFLGLFNSFVNFYIYCLMGTRFRRSLKKVLLCKQGFISRGPSVSTGG